MSDETKPTGPEAVVPEATAPDAAALDATNPGAAASDSEEAPVHTVHNISSKEEFYQVIKGEVVTLSAGGTVLPSKKVVILDSFAIWCGPCKMIAPVFQDMAKEFTNVHFIKFDVDQLPDLAQELGVAAMPTFFIFKDGQKVDKIQGANPPAIKAALVKYSAGA
ncbi:thioredoxin-like protein [Sodiomyces alkalinus F11]|uniref:Thioredoxin-like protein n=1 Tax=Sodiomyces alkalinus (strain CBS 110278 / VKM F-3762 / F11) TaxID=1314773 RepID=A0A3N2Q876_SODAK|nr:thioredoxin-like protein [Sodiomyces alkalinus F11]ROT42926.1 thioredoxin-like protein [Sodiomyces alkalinus F11]